MGAVRDTNAQFVPSNAIRIVVLHCGLAADVSCRIVAAELAESEAGEMVVENKSGGIIAGTVSPAAPTAHDPDDSSAGFGNARAYEQWCIPPGRDFAQ